MTTRDDPMATDCVTIRTGRLVCVVCSSLVVTTESIGVRPVISLRYTTRRIDNNGMGRQTRRQFLCLLSVSGATGLAGCTDDSAGDGESEDGDSNETVVWTPEADSTEAPSTDPPTTTTEASTTVSGPPSSDITITLENNSFDPVVASVEEDALVEWTNEDGVEHVVDSTQFNDGAESWNFFARLEAGDGTASRIPNEGVYEYYCSIHGEATMCGVVLVGDVSPAGPLPCQSDGGETTAQDGY